MWRAALVVLGLGLGLGLGVSGCGRPAPALAPAELAGALDALAGADHATRARAVERWRLDLAAWDALVVEPYRAVYDDYARAFERARPRLIAQLARPGAIATRAHFAGDPRLTRGQARARWALPVQFPGEVAELAGAPLDVVFVRRAHAWFAITGLDEAILARAAALDPACAAHLATVQPDRCGELGWVLAEAALRADRPRFDRACALAANLCPR